MRERAAVHNANALKVGVSVIVQGALQVGQWSGRADVLRRVETPSGLGPWSYEVHDDQTSQAGPLPTFSDTSVSPSFLRTDAAVVCPVRARGHQ
jgi:hypothetical protein